MFGTIKSQNDMNAVETMEIIALIVSKSTHLLIKWPQLILQLKFLKLRPDIFLNFESCLSFLGFVVFVKAVLYQRLVTLASIIPGEDSSSRRKLSNF